MFFVVTPKSGIGSMVWHALYHRVAETLLYQSQCYQRVAGKEGQSSGVSLSRVSHRIVIFRTCCQIMYNDYRRLKTKGKGL